MVPLFNNWNLLWFMVYTSAVEPWRFIILALLIHGLFGTWTLEQPSTSLMFRHHRFQWLVKRLRVTWWANQHRSITIYVYIYIYMLSDHDFRLKTRQNPFNFVLTGVEFFPFTFRVAIYKWSLWTVYTFVWSIKPINVYVKLTLKALRPLYI